MTRINIITGQTASGKTRLALDLAKKTKGVIINADSRQVYKYINITTGKDLPKDSIFQLEEKSGNLQIGYYLVEDIPVYLYDILEPDQFFSAFDWAEIALKVIKKQTAQNKEVFVVGGSFFYLKNLLFDFETKNIPPDFKLRQKLTEKTIPELQQILYNLRPDLYLSLNPSDRKNPYRLIRRIEIAKHLPDINLQGKKEYKQTFSNKLKTDIQITVLFFKDEQSMKKTIKERVKERLEKGAVEEVESLIKKGFSPEHQGMKTLGVKQIVELIQGKTDLKTAVENWVSEEIRYAKQQKKFIEKNFLNLKEWKLKKLLTN